MKNRESFLTASNNSEDEQPSLSNYETSESGTKDESIDLSSYYMFDNVPKNPRGDLMLDPAVADFPRSIENSIFLHSYIISTSDDARYLRASEKVLLPSGKYINLRLAKRCLQVDAYYLLARQHMFEDNPDQNIINVASFSNHVNQCEQLSELPLRNNESIVDKSDLIRGLAILEMRGQLDDLSHTEAGRLKEFNAITSQDCLFQKIHEKQYVAVADGKQCVLPVEDIFKFLSLPEDTFRMECSTNLDGEIGQLSKSEFAYTAANYLKQNNITGNYVLPYHMEKRIKQFIQGRYIDFSAINQLTETEDTLYKKINLSPDLIIAILGQMPENVSTLKKAAYIYVKMCLVLSYDNKVKAEDQKGEVTRIHKNLSHVEQITPENNDITCSEFNLIYAKMLMGWA